MNGIFPLAIYFSPKSIMHFPLGLYNSYSPSPSHSNGFRIPDLQELLALCCVEDAGSQRTWPIKRLKIFHVFHCEFIVQWSLSKHRNKWKGRVLMEWNKGLMEFLDSKDTWTLILAGCLDLASWRIHMAWTLLTTLLHQVVIFPTIPIWKINKTWVFCSVK